MERIDRGGNREEAAAAWIRDIPFAFNHLGLFYSYFSFPPISN